MVNLNSTTPAPPSGKTNAVMQKDSNNNVSLYMPLADVSNSGAIGPLSGDDTDVLLGDGTFGPVPGGGGGGGDPFGFNLSDPNDLTSWSWLDQNNNGSTNTVDLTNSQIVLTTDGGGDAIPIYKRTKVGATYTITVGFSHAHGGGNDGSHYSGSGIALSDGTKRICFGVLFYNGGVRYIVDYFNTVTSNSSTPFSIATLPLIGPLWFLRITQTGSNRNYYISTNNRTWVLIYQTTTTDFLTETVYGLWVRSASSVASAAVFHSFTEA